MSNAPISLPFDPPQPIGVVLYPVSKLYRFHVWDSPEAYQALNGQAPPAYDPGKRDKRWFDSSLDTSDLTAFVTYRAWRPTAAGWQLQLIAMTVAEAVAVNIPPSDTKSLPAPPTLKPWEVPARDLLPNESLKPDPFGGLMIQNNDLAAAQQAASGNWNAADETLLRAIAQDTQAIRAALRIGG